jgi:hypothetical protein
MSTKKKITKILITIIVSAIVACIKFYLEQDLLIVGIIITSIVIVILFVNFSSYICKFFKWLLNIYFRLIWKIIGIEKWFKEENAKWEIKFEKIKKQVERQKNELTEIQEKIWKTAGNNGEGLKHYLGKQSSNGTSIYILITIRSKTFKKTKKGYECNYDDYEKGSSAINRFYENKFEITVFSRTLDIHYEKLDYWIPDESEYNKDSPKKIHLYLKNDFAIVLTPGEKLELVNYNEISQFIT